MSANDPARRGFLRNLVSLPLIGGGVTLIGKPTAAAVPVTDALLDCYDTWLFLERQRLRFERYGTDMEVARKGRPEDLTVAVVTGLFKTAYVDSVRMGNDASRFHGPLTPEASTRAAVVLSAVGCGWREDGR